VSAQQSIEVARTAMLCLLRLFWFGRPAGFSEAVLASGWVLPVFRLSRPCGVCPYGVAIAYRHEITIRSRSLAVLPPTASFEVGGGTMKRTTTKIYRYKTTFADIKLSQL
jgi:hypothetical protein